MAELPDPNAPAETAGTDKTPVAQTSTAPVVDIQAQITQALAAQKAEFAAQLEKATGHRDFASLTDAQLKEQGRLQELADNNKQEAITAKAELGKVKIDNALLAASTEALDPSVVSVLLSGKAVCDDNGVVTIDGKPVADAVKALLTEKLFLAKAQGDTGSGAPNQADLAANGGKNPWSEKHFNLTEQSRIHKTDPALAEKLKAAASA
jgi:hypothetical protein